MTGGEFEHVIAERAARWHATRVHAEKLRCERAKHECAVEQAWYADPDSRGEKPLPCWKVLDPAAVQYDGNGVCEDDGRMDPGDYCAPCVEREKLRPAFRAAMAKRGGAERAFWAAVRAFAVEVPA